MEQVVAKKSFIPLILEGIWMVLLLIFILIPNELPESMMIVVYIALGVLGVDVLWTFIRPLNIIKVKNHTFIISRLYQTITISYQDIEKIDFYKATRRGLEFNYGTIKIHKKDGQTIRIMEVGKVIDVYLKMDALMDEYTINA